jgi:ubiquinone/menaquinone biosynthesis C-methylase UbiE
MALFPDSDQLESEIIRSMIRSHRKRVLEVGCGDGRLLHHYALDLAGAAVGVDPDPDEITVARDELPFIHFALAEAQALPFPDQSFDLVVFAWSL